MNKILLLSVLVVLSASCKNDSTEAMHESPTKKELSVSEDENVATPIIRDTISGEITAEEVAGVTLNEKASTEAFDKKDYAAFGAAFTLSTVLNKEEMLKKYKSLKVGDTISVAFESKINEVCKKKGCWMDVALGKDQKSFVKFKDYGFFVPLNADKSDVIIKGKAFIDEVSVAELKHYAKDGGKSQEEIDKISSPKVTYAFQADGVLIKK